MGSVGAGSTAGSDSGAVISPVGSGTVDVSSLPGSDSPGVSVGVGTVSIGLSVSCSV